MNTEKMRDHLKYFPHKGQQALLEALVDFVEDTADFVPEQVPVSNKEDER